jgi:signal transduction histidine kinase
MFDEQSWPGRLAVLLALAVGYLVLLPDPAARPSLTDWVLALTAVLVTGGGARWPLASVVTVAVLLVVAYRVGDTGPVVVKVAASLALLELAIRRSGWPLAVGAAALGGIYLAHPEGGPLALVYRAAVLVGAPVLLGAYVRSVRQVAAQAQDRAAEQQRRRLAEVRAAERTAIARELHDLVAHHVASTVLRVGVARHVLPAADPRIREVLDDVHASGTATLAELRRLVGVLRDPAAQPPGFVEPAELPAALEAVIDRGRQLGLDISSSLDARLSELDTVRGLAVLRLAQEGLTNVAKHAGPQARAEVSMRLEPDGALALSIVDHGGGATAGPGASAGGSPGGSAGHGLAGMRERVALLGGSLSVGPDGPGWRLSARLPAGDPA